MDEYWATRTGRWRRAMQGRSGPSFAARLFEVIHSDIGSGALPAGALLPTAERAARELMISATDVRAAYGRLLAEGLIGERSDHELYIPGPADGPEATVGDATQIRFEAALLRAVREAAAHGLSATQAAGMSRTAMLRVAARSARRDEPRRRK